MQYFWRQDSGQGTEDYATSSIAAAGACNRIRVDSELTANFLKWTLSCFYKGPACSFVRFVMIFHTFDNNRDLFNKRRMTFD